MLSNVLTTPGSAGFLHTHTHAHHHLTPTPLRVGGQSILPLNRDAGLATRLYVCINPCAHVHALCRTVYKAQDPPRLRSHILRPHILHSCKCSTKSPRPRPHICPNTCLYARACSRKCAKPTHPVHTFTYPHVRVRTRMQQKVRKAHTTSLTHSAIPFAHWGTSACRKKYTKTKIPFMLRMILGTKVNVIAHRLDQVWPSASVGKCGQVMPG